MKFSNAISYASLAMHGGYWNAEKPMRCNLKARHGGRVNVEVAKVCQD